MTNTIPTINLNLKLCVNMFAISLILPVMDIFRPVPEVEFRYSCNPLLLRGESLIVQEKFLLARFELLLR